MSIEKFNRILIEGHLYLHGDGIFIFPTAEARALREKSFRQAFTTYAARFLWPMMATLRYDVGSKARFDREWNLHITRFSTCTTGDEFKVLLEVLDEYLVALNREVVELGEAREREKLSYFNGTYRSTESQTPLVPLLDNALIYGHRDKHFKRIPGLDAQYSGTKGYVAALEAKAVRLGIAINGDIYFYHNANVGTLGTRHGLSQSRCIRVDAPGGATQHSHPFPESLASGSPDATHDSLLAELIVDCASSNDLDYLGRVAKYLADVGGHVIVLNAAQKRKVKSELPACPYWR